MVTDGFRKIIFLNGHGGNIHMMTQTANDLAVRHPVWTASASYWDIARPSLNEVNVQEMGLVPGHADGFETALIMALQPALVKTEHIHKERASRSWISSSLPGTFIGKHGELTGHDGYTDTPAVATAEKGRLYLKTIVSAVREWLIATYHTMADGEANGK